MDRGGKANRATEKEKKGKQRQKTGNSEKTG